MAELRKCKGENAMLTEERLNEILARSVAAQSHRAGGRRGGSDMIRLLPKNTARTDLPMPPVRDLELALTEIGSFLERGTDHWTVLVPCGYGDMNQAVLVAVPDGETVHVRAWAKEGLISQHSAEKAVAKLQAALL